MIGSRRDFILFEKAVDLTVVYLCWLFAYFFRFEKMAGEAGLLNWYLQYGLLLVFVTGYLFKIFGVYVNDYLVKKTWIQFKANLVALFVFVFLAFFFTEHRISRILLLIYFLSSTFILMLIKYIFEKISQKNKIRVIVIGDGNAARKYKKEISTLKKFELVGVSEEDVEKKGADLIVLGYENKDFHLVDEVLRKYSEELVSIVVLPDLESSVLGYDIQTFRGIPMIAFNELNYGPVMLLLKRIIDVVLCSIGLIILSPLLLLISLFVKLTSKGPIFYAQVRMGLDGKEFSMWKFRSMKIVENSEGWTVKNDPRVTRIGKILRKTSLDELPQLLNVIIGDMSLVGPRPERPHFVNEFKKGIPSYMLRHKMRAGITGWAQINGWRGDTSISKRIECDLWYIKNWSLWLDLWIIFMTFWKGLVNKNAY